MASEFTVEGEGIFPFLMGKYASKHYAVSPLEPTPEQRIAAYKEGLEFSPTSPQGPSPSQPAAPAPAPATAGVGGFQGGVHPSTDMITKMVLQQMQQGQGQGQPQQPMMPSGIKDYGLRSTGQAPKGYVSYDTFKAAAERSDFGQRILPTLPVGKPVSQTLLSTVSSEDRTKIWQDRVSGYIEQSRKRNELYGKSIDVGVRRNIEREYDPLIATSPVARTLANNNIRANRAKMVLLDSTSSGQMVNRAQTDLDFMFKGGVPTEYEGVRSEYRTLQNSWNNLKTLISKTPQPFNQPEIQKQIFQITQGILSLDNHVYKKHLNSIDSRWGDMVSPKWIEDFKRTSLDKLQGMSEADMANATQYAKSLSEDIFKPAPGEMSPEILSQFGFSNEDDARLNELQADVSQ